jgi:hypothetical protein
LDPQLGAVYRHISFRGNVFRLTTSVSYLDPAETASYFSQHFEIFFLGGNAGILGVWLAAPNSNELVRNSWKIFPTSSSLRPATG